LRLIYGFQGIPDKGIILTKLTTHWFDILKTRVPTLRTHFLSLELPLQVPEALRPSLQNRSMQVRKLKIFPIEAIVRGYITGSAWSEYQKHGTVHGIAVPPGLQESQGFPGGPMYTPSTKAEAGQHDENIHPDQGMQTRVFNFGIWIIVDFSKAIQLVGAEYATRISTLAIALYEAAHAHALAHCIIIADTKFEFGLDEETDEVVLVDEVLTPDSSRFWRMDKYGLGRSQDSFDKQYLRDWLVSEGLKGKEGVRMPDDVVAKTAEKYKEAYEVITGEKFAR
jgi:phosphoribosylaminoimidazole-succinocarboxamide synthase